MAREFARIRTSIADDESVEDLGPEAQWLYFRVLLPEPKLSSCGVYDWRPNRLTRKARGITVAYILSAAAELEQARYILVDLDTEEVLVRSYIRTDELLRNPKMAANVVKEYRSIASKTLQAAVVSEIKRVHREHPEYSCWTSQITKDDLAVLVSRPDLESIGYTNRITNPIGDTGAVPITNGINNRNTNGIGNPHPDSDYQSDYQRHSLQTADYRPQTADLQTADEGGYVSPEGHQASDSDLEPPPRCPKHLDNPTDAACRACGEARRAAEAWIAKERRRATEAVRERRRAADDVRARAIAACTICDDDGYANGRVCDHDPHSAERARNGVAAVRAALAAKGRDDA